MVDKVKCWCFECEREHEDEPGIAPIYLGDKVVKRCFACIFQSFYTRSLRKQQETNNEERDQGTQFRENKQKGDDNVHAG